MSDAIHIEHLRNLMPQISFDENREALKAAIVALAARDAVAELIEAVKAIKAARGGTMALGAQDARTIRLWAALARVGGDA
ncbi:hypothetical protein [Bradyrhizobium sp. 613_E4_N2_2]|uniref:hypothetical protein n=1 Tax=Bradyrhizobium sp. 613_E4_N2_2 TaxID=3240371 RepID=UPI003F89CAD9